MGKRILLAAIAFLALASTGWAAEAEYSGMACGSAKSTILESSPELTVMTTESWFIQTPASTFKPWDNNVGRCVNYVRISAGKRFAKGSCRWVDPSGDMFIGEIEEHPDKGGTWTFLAGTGKWKGIKGGGTFKAVSGGKPQPDGTAQFCFEHSGKYTLP
jgi:hypothetical protein